MFFNSYSFVYIFLPLAMFVLWLAGRLRIKAVWPLLVISLSWIYFISPTFLLIVFASLVFNYLYSLVLRRLPYMFMLWPALLANIGLWSVYKYWPFFGTLYKLAFARLGEVPELAYPLGLGMLTVFQLAYLADVRRHKSGLSPMTYAASITWFPKLLAGPPVALHSFREQLAAASAKWERKNIGAGLFLFFNGLFKKVVLADTFLEVAYKGFSVESLNMPQAWVVYLAVSLGLYFEISGWVDMARGLSRMFNIDLPRQFARPWRATNPLRFWAGWFRGLSAFFRDYVYIPLSGKSNNTLRRGLALLTTFLVAALFHHFSSGLILWAFYSFGIIVLYKIWTKLPFLRFLRRFRRFTTFNLLAIGWLFFLSSDAMQALTVIKGMLSLRSLFVFYNEFYLLWSVEANYLTVLMLLASLWAVLRLPGAYDLEEKFRFNSTYLLKTIILAIISLWFLNHNYPFVYYAL